MKNLTLFALLVLLSACCGTKKIIENSKKETAQVITKAPQVPETPKTPETPKVPETPKTEIPPVETEVKVETPISTPVNDDVITPPPAEEPILTTPAEPKTTFNHSSWNEILEQYVSTQGNVNYRGLSKNKAPLRNYITSLGENMPNNSWSKSEKMSYWINAYNAMTVDLILRNYPIKSIKDIKDPWKQRLWKLGSKWYNLDEIEHKILRKTGDARIHFAIVCASYSCPKLANEAFIASRLELQLNIATKAFLMDTERNKISASNIQLSKIFKWFADDFKTNGSLIDFLNEYSDISISKNAKKSFLDYNWNLNQ